MILILIIVLIYPIFTGGCLLVLNEKGLIPGTGNYKRIQALKQSEFNAERARIDAITSRYRIKENENINTMLALEAPK